MTQRTITAWMMTALLASALFITSDAEARTSNSSSGRSHSSSEHRGSGSSRSCLTSSARALLNRIESKFGAMQIVSTCRPGATIAGSGRVSRHASGNAIDFSAGHRKGAVISWLKQNHHNGGTMTYAGMDHIHVDIGQHFVSLSGGSRSASNSASRSRSSREARDWNSGRMALGAKRGETLQVIPIPSDQR